MAELPLAVIPVATKALHSCLELYKLFTEASRLGSASQALLWKFRIQHKRLRIWGEEWGLLASTSHRAGDAAAAAPDRDRDVDDDSLVLETLVRIESILKDYRLLNERYGLSLASDDPQFRRMVSDNSCRECLPWLCRVGILCADRIWICAGLASDAGRPHGSRV